MDAEQSAVARTLGLKDGEAYGQVKFLRNHEASPDEIKTARKKLMRLMSPIISRASAKDGRSYRFYTTASFTPSYDVIVTGVIVVNDEDDDEI